MKAHPPPPEGPPWDLPLDEAELAFVDLEMTGLDAAKDHVIEIYVERVRGGAVVARFHSLVRPEGLDPEKAVGNVHVHGIDAQALAEAPTFAAIVDDVVKILDGAVLVAHGASWDVAFLHAELARCGRSTRITHWLDTLSLSRRTFALPSHALSALRTHFGLDASRAHRADADVEALRRVFEQCIKALEPRTPRDLWEVRVAEQKARAQILEECREAMQKGTPVVVVYRARARKAEPIRMVITQVLENPPPPRVLGYDLPGRGRRSLRADRILRLEPTPAS